MVRAFALSAREKRVPAVEAIVQLKRELEKRGEHTTPAAVKTARRWFIDTFYFG